MNFEGKSPTSREYIQLRGHFEVRYITAIYLQLKEKLNYVVFGGKKAREGGGGCHSIGHINDHHRVQKSS